VDKLPWIYLVVAFALIYVPRGIVTREMKKLPGGYDNASPRDQQAKLEGVGRRALAAHQNGFESFPIFAAGLLASIVGRVPALWIAIIGGVHVVARILYVVFYIGDKPTGRSGVWTLALLASVALMILPIFQ
jgi:uncharacterized MAPEG superfamily protein